MANNSLIAYLPIFIPKVKRTPVEITRGKLNELQVSPHNILYFCSIIMDDVIEI